MQRSDLRQHDLLPMATMDLGDGDYVLVVPGAIAETTTEILVQLQPVGAAEFCPQ